MKYQDRLDLIEEAQELLKKAVEKIDLAVRGTGEENTAQAYITSHLEIIIDSNHSQPYSSTPNLDDVWNNLNIERDEWEEADWRSKLPS